MDTEEIYSKFLESSGAVTDTRKELKGKMFFALKGPNFNGNTYASMAISLGALFAIVEEKEYADGSTILLVDDVLLTLQSIAALHKRKLGIPVIGITGTNGKTTNKELLFQILSKKYKCHSTKGNLNNHIGVPLTLLEIKPSHEFAIIEMGANKMGDIKELCAITDPDYGYITNIGKAHLEGFRSKENIKIEKGELFRYVKNKNGVFFVNTSEPEVLEISDNYHNAILIGERENDTYKFRWQASIPKVKLSYGDQLFTSNLYGKHNYENIKMAIGIGLYLKVPSPEISQVLKAYLPVNNRSQIIRNNGLVIFMDAYNANPSSMKSSIASFANFEAKKKCLILGDMLEMGEHSLREHRGIMEFIYKYKWKRVVLIGLNFMQFQEEYSDYEFFKSREEADLYMTNNFSSGTHLLIKGSRGQSLEKLQFIQHLR